VSRTRRPPLRVNGRNLNPRPRDRGHRSFFVSYAENCPSRARPTACPSPKLDLRVILVFWQGSHHSKSGLVVTESNRHVVDPDDLAAWEAAADEFSSRPSRRRRCKRSERARCSELRRHGACSVWPLGVFRGLAGRRVGAGGRCHHRQVKMCSRREPLGPYKELLKQGTGKSRHVPYVGDALTGDVHANDACARESGHGDWRRMARRLGRARIVRRRRGGSSFRRVRPGAVASARPAAAARVTWARRAARSGWAAASFSGAAGSTGGAGSYFRNCGHHYRYRGLVSIRCR
jgi:hypothetical protein